jgi:sensor histidine kinase regulating citrate/malate metabolism
VETQINLPDENTVTDMDLCVIFGNGLENAIHACKGVPVEEDRFIRIQCKNKNGKLFIQIANSYEGDVEFEEGMPISKVEDHGLGTKSIAAVSEKYEGVYSFVAKDGVFTTSIII